MSLHRVQSGQGGRTRKWAERRANGPRPDHGRGNSHGS
jgi:hypothetical protein